MYSGDFLSLRIISEKIGKIEDHYDCFVTANNKGKCPYCGIFSLDSQYDPSREAYDHYLPKSKYPFNSINFKNLAPMCEKCNSRNKGVKDPLYSSNGTRRKSFYSYQTNQPRIEIEVEVQTRDWNQLKPEEIQIRTGSAALREEIFCRFLFSNYFRRGSRLPVSLTMRHCLLE